MAIEGLTEEESADLMADIYQQFLLNWVMEESTAEDDHDPMKDEFS